jgi:hypothetical protein
MVCHDEQTKEWLAARVPTLAAWDDSRLTTVELEGLPTYKRVLAWFPGPVEDTERYMTPLCRLNRVLDPKHWRVYERREETNGVRLVLSIDTASVAVLEKLKWKPFRGVAQAVFSLPGAKSEGKN